MGMYEAPIHLIQQQIQSKIEGEILTAVHKIHAEVDKDELLRALQYDRDQYNKGYADGKADAMASIVRCKDCKYWINSWVAPGAAHAHGYCHIEEPDDVVVGRGDDDFCSYGERKDNG